MPSLLPYDEYDLIQQFNQGGKEAFETLYNQYYLSVFRFAKRFLNDRAGAEDITLEAFLKLWNKREHFDHREKIKSFLFTTTKNACLNYLRSETRQFNNRIQLQNVVAQETETNFLQHEITEKAFQYLAEEIEKLPPKMKTILQLQLQGLNNQQIAEHMKTAEKTVRNLKVEAIKLLRAAAVKRELSVWILFLYYFGPRV